MLWHVHFSQSRVTHLFLHLDYERAVSGSWGYEQLVWDTRRNMNDVTGRDGLNDAVTNAGTSRFTVASQMRINQFASGDERCLSFHYDHHIVEVGVNFCAAAYRSFGEFDCVRSIVTER